MYTHLFYKITDKKTLLKTRGKFPSLLVAAATNPSAMEGYKFLCAVMQIPGAKIGDTFKKKDGEKEAATIHDKAAEVAKIAEARGQQYFSVQKDDKDITISSVADSFTLASMFAAAAMAQPGVKAALVAAVQLL